MTLEQELGGLIVNNQNIKSIVFDLGNVLIDFDHMIAARRICEFTEKEPQEIFDLFFYSGITKLFEEGKISPGDFFLKVKEMLELKIDYPEFVPIWNEIFFLTGKNLGVYNLAKKLKLRYTISLLSNINELHFDYLKRNFPVFDVFDHLFLSYELNSVKPNYLIYEKLLEILSLKPAEVFYTDDRKELIEAAEKTGIVSFQFTDLKKLKSDLSKSGVIIN